MTMRRPLAWLLLGGCLLLGPGVMRPMEAAPEQLPERLGGESRAASAANAFGLELLRQLPPEQGNLVVSPIGLCAALLMIAGGAGGTTAGALQQVLQQGSGPAALQAWTRLTGSLTAPRGTNGLSLGQSIWPARQIPLQPTYSRRLKRDFGSVITPLDFQGDPHGSARQINQWVSAHTGGRIQEIVSAAELSPDLALAVVSAVWFKGAWEMPFEPEQTRPGRFVLSNGTIRSVPMMERTGGYRIGRIPGGRLLELPYQPTAGSRAQRSMLILRPDRHDGLAELERRLTPAALRSWSAGLERERVQLELPRFQIRSRTDLQEPLTRMGLGVAFGPGADFSGISAGDAVRLSRVLQEATLQVDEAGSEATAATMALMPVLGLSETPIPVFRVDHPVLLIIRDQASGALLFLARLMDPSPAEQG